MEPTPTWRPLVSLLSEPPERRERRLDALARTGLLDSPPEPAFDRLTGLVQRVLGVPVALVSFVDGDRQFFKSQRGLAEPWASARQSPLSHSFCQYVVASGAPLAVDDARAHRVLCDNPAVRDLRVVAYLGVPVRGADGLPIGSLCAIDDEPRAWGPDDEAVLLDLAALVETEIRHRAALGERGRSHAQY